MQKMFFGSKIHVMLFFNTQKEKNIIDLDTIKIEEAVQDDRKEKKKRKKKK